VNGLDRSTAMSTEASELVDDLSRHDGWLAAIDAGIGSPTLVYFWASLTGP
jgi:hypothetical protein